MGIQGNFTREKSNRSPNIGRILIPAAEVERILGEAGIYNGLPKAKIQKRTGRLDAWRKFVDQRQKSNGMTRKASNTKSPTAAIERLKKRFSKP